MANELEKSEQYRVLRKYEEQDFYCSDCSDDKLFGVYVDVETTGLIQGKDKIIELAIVGFEFLPDGRIFRILKKFDEFEDPGFPISTEITALTGITDEMVEGKHINEDV